MIQKQKIHSDKGFRYRLKISKTGELKFISHLDWQKLIYYSIRKSGLKINYSQGYNPAPKISVGIALPLFIQGKNEYIDIELQEEIADNIIKEKLNSILPENSQISDIVKISKDKPSIEKEVCWAVYRAIPENTEENTKINIESIAKEFLLKQNILIDKQSKKGIKKVNIRPGVYSLHFDKDNNILEFTLKAGVGLINQPQSVSSESTSEDVSIKEIPSAPKEEEKLLMQEKVSVSSIRADEFLKILTPEMDWRITREKLLDCNFNELIN